MKREASQYNGVFSPRKRKNDLRIKNSTIVHDQLKIKPGEVIAKFDP